MGSMQTGAVPSIKEGCSLARNKAPGCGIWGAAGALPLSPWHPYLRLAESPTLSILGASSEDFLLASTQSKLGCWGVDA